MKLFYGAASPYSRKVRVVAHELGVPLELVAVNAMAWDTALGNANPINRVPTLLRDDGLALFDSPVICEYLDTSFGPLLLPASGEARWRALLAQALGDGLMDAAVPRRHETLRPGAQQSPERLRLYRRSIDQILDRLEHDADARANLDLGAISIACGLAYLDFRFPDDRWGKRRPALQEWFDDFSKRQSMAATEFA
ncbi:glutathione S-transferase N-terminal domain-containing protein [Devosia sp.]|uniref:glutathione S-transferase N-terminal domain-containing protein n=1 Tax=Devosia sp. TaxID=1871048 RepID=UPI002AFF24A1|nr:glutathione S-transferase N-terminal domain-containing protein [Devosia sp.]